MMRALGSEERLPLAPAPSKKAPIDAAIPKHTVFTSHGTNLQKQEEEENERDSI
jgi:hypothetical protein